MLENGKKSPEFTAIDENGVSISLNDFKGKKIILYFYPKDNTPGCTVQAIAFTEMRTEFEAENCIILGVSKDSCKKHQNFIAKQNLNITLISDEEGELCEKYGVWVLKKLYGREYMGIERTSFLIDEEGKIHQIWRKVKVKNHVAEVLEIVKSMS
jgi:peroxiredoxin